MPIFELEIFLNDQTKIKNIYAILTTQYYW